MTKIQDLRGNTMGGNDKRSTIKKIARHHSAISTGNVYTFENHWKNARGWNTGGCHEVILRDGTVQLCYDYNVVSNGVYGHNKTTYHICVVGDGDFTPEQEKAFDERARYNLDRFNLRVYDLLGHKEFSGASTACPGIDMNKVRSLLKGGTIIKNQPKQQVKSTSKLTSKANLKVDGKWGNSTTEALQKALGTPGDGILSNQSRNSVTESLYGNTVRYGKGGSLVIKALQRKVGSKDDGLLGPATVRALQKYLGTVQDGVLSRPSLVVQDLQRRLNKGNL